MSYKTQDKQYAHKPTYIIRSHMQVWSWHLCPKKIPLISLLSLLLTYLFIFVIFLVNIMRETNVRPNWWACANMNWFVQIDETMWKYLQNIKNNNTIVSCSLCKSLFLQTLISFYSLPITILSEVIHQCFQYIPDLVSPTYSNCSSTWTRDAKNNKRLIAVFQGSQCSHSFDSEMLYL